jgi:hypothetical protein
MFRQQNRDDKEDGAAPKQGGNEHGLKSGTRLTVGANKKYSDDSAAIKINQTQNNDRRPPSARKLNSLAEILKCTQAKKLLSHCIPQSNSAVRILFH